MDWRIRQNGPAHAWYTIHVYIFERAGGFCGSGPPGGAGPGPTPQKPPAHSNIYTCIVYHACAGPFWRMRQSILANAPVHFIECACLFWRMSYSGIRIQVFRYSGAWRARLVPQGSLSEPSEPTALVNQKCETRNIRSYFGFGGPDALVVHVAKWCACPPLRGFY